MPRLNELLGPAQQYSKGVAAQFGLEEQEGVPTVAPELVPVSDIHARPEQWALHGGCLLWGIVNVAAGGAGTRAYAAVEPGTGELVVVEGALLGTTGGTPAYLNVGTSNTALTTSTGNLVSRDARMIITTGGSASSGTRIMTQNNAAAGGIASQVALLILPGDRMVYHELNMVLVSPWSLRFYPSADNTPINTLTLFVRSRPATPRELAVGQL